MNDLEKRNDNSDLGNPIWYSSDYRKAESELCSSNTDDSEDESEDEEFNKESCDDEGSEEDTEQLTQNDKYLIFTTGFKTYTPHQIGIVYV